MTRTKEEVALVLSLWKRGLNHCEIARRTGIPRPTVRDWATGKVPTGRRVLRRRGDACNVCGHARHDPAQLPRDQYVYLLGAYLGDGCVSRLARNAYALRLFQDMRYPGLIREWATAVRAVMPTSSVYVQYNVGGGKCAEVKSLSKAWPCLFPQHGPGRKHTRSIVLVGWQKELVDQDPRPLIRGLIHSDGCRVINKSMGHEYLRYMFSNKSMDIRNIFKRACDQLDIPWRQSRVDTISIARREGIEILDSFVGPKS
jgi:hypothetical protein